MRNEFEKTAGLPLWRAVREIGEIVGGVLLFLAILVGGVMLPGLLWESASSVGLRATQAAQR